MKRWIVVVASLMTFAICGSPLPADPVKAEIAAWTKLFPEWNSYSMMEQEKLIQLYQFTPNKHLWFPDSFPDTYRRKNLYHHKYNRIRK